MKTLGLLGGMTYHATALYYSQTNAHVQSTLGSGHSAKIILHSFDFADIMSHFHRKDYDEFTRQLVAAGQNLKMSGADALVLCVNTAHMFADVIERDVDLPLLHIMDFAGKAIHDAGLKKVALLGTKPVMQGSFMTDRLRAKFGIEVLIPEEDVCVKMHDIIFGPLADGVVSEETKEFYLVSARNLVEKGAQGIVLACTELQFVLKDEDFSVPLFDTVKLHARGVAEWALMD